MIDKWIIHRGEDRLRCLRAQNPMTMIFFSQTMNDDETYKSNLRLFLLSTYTLWLTFAAGAPDVDDLFASVDERLLNLSEFSRVKEVKKEIGNKPLEVWCGKKKKLIIDPCVAFKLFFWTIMWERHLYVEYNKPFCKSLHKWRLFTCVWDHSNKHWILECANRLYKQRMLMFEVNVRDGKK